MVSPVTVGTTATVVIPINKTRTSVRFQNVGLTTINLKKVPLTGAFSIVSISDFEIQLFASSTSIEAGEAFETNSINSFMAISSATGGSLAIYETNKI